MSGIDFNNVLQDAAEFTGGFFNALGSDQVLGAGRRDQPTLAGKVGATFGDATATIQGLFESTQGGGAIGAGIGGEAVGIGLDATGVGIPFGVPVGAVSAGLIVAGSGLAVHGTATGLTGAAHLATDTVQLTHLAMAKAKKGGSNDSVPNSGRNTSPTNNGWTSQLARQKAAKMGFKEVKGAPFSSHGQPVFKKGNVYITPDIDGHNTYQGWKEFNQKGQRIGTFNTDLTEKIGK